MAGLCVPSCTKELGRAQRRRHWKRVQAALGRASDLSDASSANRDLDADRHFDSIPGEFYQDDGSPVQGL
ncbi:hypothetical protein JB92DRAFT_2888680, partial [Gautieria morchelliformis]